MWHRRLTRRLRVLLYAEPILELRSLNDKENLETHHYDSIALAVCLLDRIVESMGLDDAASSEAVINALEPLMSKMDFAAGVEESDAGRHRQFARKILDRLRQKPSTEYTDFDDDESVVRRKLEFSIINERWVSDERTALELSSEAINLFLNAFEFDVEDAQAALEAVTQSQLERGLIDRAAASARDARIRSIQFQNKIQQILRDTRRDVSRLDWREDVPKILDQALAHINGRLQTEKYIGESARERLLSFEPDGNEAAQARLISELMEDCINRHGDLLRLLINARGVFLDEQARQAFTMRASGHLPNLLTDVLEPLFAAPKQAAQTALDGVENEFGGALPALLGARVSEVFSLKNVVARLLRPPHESPETTVPSDEQIWDEEIIETPRYPSEIERAALAHLQILPTRLSSLLENATAAGAPQETLEYITLAALRGFESEAATDWQSEPTGAAFRHAGFWGDDLELRGKTTGEREENQ